MCTSIILRSFHFDWQQVAMLQPLYGEKMKLCSISFIYNVSHFKKIFKFHEKSVALFAEMWFNIATGFQKQETLRGGSVSKTLKFP